MWICIGLIIIAIAWHYMSPVFILMGISLVVFYVFVLLIHKKLNDEDDEASLGCGCALILVIGACSFFFNSGEDYYVSGWGDKRHQYGDCVYRVNNNRDYKVGRFSAIIMGCLSDCDTCKERKKIDRIKVIEENERKFAEWKQRKHLSDIEDIKKKIEELEEVLSRLLDGENIDASNYDFRKDIEEEIREEVEAGY